MRLCVIPARGGSKRIPRKNIRIFDGKPMIAWSIDAARASNCFDQIIVSTDDDEIADVARDYGAEVPFIRPQELADDFVGTMPVISHAIRFYQSRNEEPSEVCCLYATAPFVQPSFVLKGCELLRQVPASRFVFTAAAYSTSIQRALRLDTKTRSARMISPAHFSTRSQDLESYYYDAGQFYWGRPQAWLYSINIFEGSTPLVLPKWCVQDIDTEDDWSYAELMRLAITLRDPDH